MVSYLDVISIFNCNLHNSESEVNIIIRYFLHVYCIRLSFGRGCYLVILFQEHMQMPAIRNFIDKLKSQLVDETEITFHATRIDCIGSIGQPHVEALSFREDLMDRKS